MDFIFWLYSIAYFFLCTYYKKKKISALLEYFPSASHSQEYQSFQPLPCFYLVTFKCAFDKGKIKLPDLNKK